MTSIDDAAQAVQRRAFIDELEKAGYSCAAEAVPLDPSATLQQWRHTERTIGAWMQGWQLPIGVYVGGETHSRMVAELCRGRGLRVPEDVAIIAGSNQEILCEHPRPSLTSVELGYERIGYEAARLLDRLMDARDTDARAGRSAPPDPEPEHILIPPLCLVVRESTDFFAVDEPLVRAALEYISANSHLPITPADVARGVFVEVRTLQRRFREYLDRTIAAEIRRARIERAKRELSQSKQSLSEIAHSVGFGGAMRMYEVFRRELGVTPSEYRRQQQAPQSK